MSSSKTALAIELFAGLHGWGEGLSAAGFRVVGFDIADMPRMLNHPVPEHCSLVLQDVLTLHGSQFRDASLIVASPPCQEFSYMAMPFSRGKRIAAALRGQGEFPEKYTDSRTIPELTALFDACFRIQREASEAAGRYIPLVVENVRGAQPWVGRAKWSYGSYYLWGDVPALMPSPTTLKLKGGDRNKNRDRGHAWTCSFADTLDSHDHEKTGKPGRSFQSAAVAATAAVKVSGIRLSEVGFNVAAARRIETEKPADYSRTGEDKRQHIGFSRRAASALIAKIPFALAEHIGRVYYPHAEGRIA